MNAQELFNDIVTFLYKHSSMWESEVLQGYPESLAAYPKNWIDQLDRLSIDQLWKIDAFNDTTSLREGDLKQYYKDLGILANRVPFLKNSNLQLPYNDRTFYKVKRKKRHEIERISPIIEELNQRNNYSSLVDIGGGQGHLARVISSYHQLAGVSVDCSKEFQSTGESKLCKYPHYTDGKKIKYVNHMFGENTDQDAMLLAKNTLTVGLHTCGPLALRHFEAFSKSDARTLLNFGCCYLRMNVKTDTNLSNYCKQNKHIKLSKYALTLATRSHSEMSIEQFKLKKRVKQYRNMLHLMMIEKFNRKNFISVGDSPPSHYWGSFYNYVCEKFTFMGEKLILSESDVEDFFAQDKFQKVARDMFLADIIRWKLGRPLELYILLDRLMWVQDMGIKAELFQLFDEKLSPRNIGILASKY